MAFKVDHFNQLPIIGILRGIDSARVERIVDLYSKVGFTTVEITMNTPGATEMIKSLRSTYTDLNIGAGTIRNKEELMAALNAGATFIVTPFADFEVINICVDQTIPIFVGAYTPLEIYNAWKAGATAIKIFPATTGGLKHIKAIKGPLDMIPLIPTGGIGPHNLVDCLNIGVYGVGMGSQLFPKVLVEAENRQELEQHLMQIKCLYDEWKSSSQ